MPYTRSHTLRFLALLYVSLPGLTNALEVDVTKPPYNAKGDGSTDDVAAIQAAVDSLKDSGGTILLPAPHQFAVSKPIRLYNLNSITLQGGGQHVGSVTTRGASLLSLTPNSTVLILNQCGHCNVNNLFIGHAITSGDRIPLLDFDQPRINTPRTTRRTSRRTSRTPTIPDHTVERILPTSGCSIIVINSFEAIVERIWFEGVHGAIHMTQFANTLTVLDTTIVSAYGPYGIRMAGDSVGARVDVMQISRLTTNNYVTAQGVVLGNASIVWIDMGSGANTLRLDNVGLIHGGIGLRLSSEWTNGSSPGVTPGRPLFVFANDLEIDFPMSNAIQLDQGETVTLSNAYIQGSQTQNGVFINQDFNSEVQIVNSRIFGHYRSGIVLNGGRHHLISNCIIGDNSIIGVNRSSGILITKNVSDFIISSNTIGPVFKNQEDAQHKYGIEIEQGHSDRFIITSNSLLGNIAGGLSNGGAGKTTSIENNLL